MSQDNKDAVCGVVALIGIVVFGWLAFEGGKAWQRGQYVDGSCIKNSDIQWGPRISVPLPKGGVRLGEGDRVEFEIQIRQKPKLEILEQ